jgi:hypothetical protein
MKVLIEINNKYMYTDKALFLCLVFLYKIYSEPKLIYSRTYYGKAKIGEVGDFFLKRLWLIITVLLLALGNSSIGIAEWAGVELPVVTGPYEVGTVVLPMVDSGRPGVYADGSFSKHREFMTQIWYPANRDLVSPRVHIWMKLLHSRSG